MKKNLMLAIALFIIIVLGVIILFMLPSGANAPTNNNTSTTTPTGAGAAGIADLISVTFPTKGAEISNPVTITGTARGMWYFEASFPVEILDESGTSIAMVPAQAQGEWMTENFVPFSVTVSFPAQPAGSRGTLILHKDNPSGEPERDQSVIIPITFK